MILGSFLADIVAVKMFYTNGEWSLALFFAQIFGITFTCFIFGLLFGPIYDRIKRNLFVRNRDHSVASVFRAIGRIILCIAPLVASFLLAFSGVSEGMAKFIMFFGCIITTIITGAYAKRRNKKIEKTFREGCKSNSNIEEVIGNNITDHDIMDCVTCDYINRQKNLIIKHDLSDVNFSAVEYVTRVSKNSDDRDPAEVISYNINKIAKSPIICTFDKELTDAPMQLIETENPAFNKEFYTYCDNAEDAFYILTPQVMERMIAVAKIYKRLIFNFDGDELFIIVYQDKFMNTLAKEDAHTAFAELNKMLNDLVIKDIAKAGVHVSRRNNKPEAESQFVSKKITKKTKTWKIVVIVIVLIAVLAFIIPGIVVCSTINGTPTSKNSVINKEEVTQQDYAPIQNYLSQKYGINFIYDETEYSSIYDSDYSRTVYAYFKDPNGIKLEARSDAYKRDSQKIDYSDSYQSIQYNDTLSKQIMMLNPNIEEVKITAGYYTEKFSSIDQYLAKGECQFLTVFLKDGFGDINENTTLDLSKAIINSTKISNAFINFYNRSSYSLKCTYRYKNGEFYLS